MTTTVMRDSLVGDNWIYDSCAAVPVQWVYGEDGQPTGDILTGPVRLAFDNLFELPQPTKEMPNPKFGASLLFTPYSDMSVFDEAYWNVCCQDFMDYYDSQSNQFYGLHSPFRDQAEKVKFGGFTPGCTFITSTSKFQPPVVDMAYNPIVDRSKVYAGVWAICAVNPYSYKDPRKKGVGFGLQSVMIIGDDTKFGGAAPDPRSVMAAARGAIKSPIARPDPSRMPQGNNGQQAAPIPGYTGGAPAPRPGAPAPRPGAPAPAAGRPGMPGRPAPSAPTLPSEEDEYSFLN